MHRVKWQRPRIDDREATPEDWPPEGDRRSFPFAWSKDVIDNFDNPTANPLGFAGSDFWAMDPPDEEWERAHPLPAEPGPDLPMAAALSELWHDRPLSRAMISCWDSHIRVWRKIIENGDNTAIIFEDDIDVEYDLEKRLQRMWPALPPDWDVVLLGHCWSDGANSPQLPEATNLRVLNIAMCTHGYAVSRRGAYQLLRHLRSPDMAYSRPVDMAMNTLSQIGRIKAFGVYPPIVIQTRKDRSDLTGDWVDSWKDVLVDSMLERIALVQNVTETGTL